MPALAGRSATDRTCGSCRAAVRSAYSAAGRAWPRNCAATAPARCAPRSDLPANAIRPPPPPSASRAERHDVPPSASASCFFPPGSSSPSTASCPLICKRHVERLQQRLCFGIRFRRRADDDVEAANLLDLVVADLREDDLLLDTHCEIAPTVEALLRQPAKVPHPRQRDVDQAIEKLVHALAPKRHLATD